MASAMLGGGRQQQCNSYYQKDPRSLTPYASAACKRKVNYLGTILLQEEMQLLLCLVMLVCGSIADECDLHSQTQLLEVASKTKFCVDRANFTFQG